MTLGIRGRNRLEYIGVDCRNDITFEQIPTSELVSLGDSWGKQESNYEYSEAELELVEA